MDLQHCYKKVRLLRKCEEKGPLKMARLTDYFLPCFISSSNFIRAHLIPSSRSFMKTLNSIGLREGQLIKALSPFFAEELRNTIHMHPRGPSCRKEMRAGFASFCCRRGFGIPVGAEIRLVIPMKTCFSDTGASSVLHGFSQCYVKGKKLIQLCRKIL